MAAQMILFSMCVSANNYDARTEDIDQKLMFPGDVLFGASELLIGEEGQSAVTGPEGEYTFNDGIVYRANRDPETGTITLLPFGHTVSVEYGISDCEDLVEDTHYTLYLEGLTQEEYFVTDDDDEDKDLAAYPQGMQVKISAGEATDGEVFDHWESLDDIVLDDPYSSDTTFVMGPESVTLRAVYVSAEDAIYNADAEDTGFLPDEDDDVYAGPDDINDEADDVNAEPDDVYNEPEDVNDEPDDVYDEPSDADGNADETPDLPEGWNDEYSRENGGQDEEIAFDENGEQIDPEQLQEFEEQEEEPLDINEGWNSDQMSAFEIPGSDEGSDSIFDHLDPDALNENGGGELDEYAENAEAQAREEEHPEAAPADETAQTLSPVDTGMDAQQLDAAPEESGEEAKTDETAAAEYTIKIVSEHVAVDGDVTVNDTNTITAKEGTSVKLAADQLDGYDFDYWEISKAADGQAVTDTDLKARETSFIMPADGVNIKAVYSEHIVETYTVSIENGEGSGTYKAGETINITAAAAPSGQKFKTWEVTGGNAALADAGAENTTFVMGSGNVSLKAVYEYIYYNLKVTSGSGSGSYKQGDEITLTAQWPADGKEFDTWLVNSANAEAARPDRFETTLTMPADHVSVQALYKDGPSVNDNKIGGITADSVYMRGETFTFSATGAGMENADPNPGDFRWKPSGYRIGSASGTFTNDRYAASMAVNAMGNYTLYVDYKKEVWNGTSWEANGATDTRSVSFVVTAPNAVQTGDDTPILPFVIAAGAALILIILLVVLRVRKKK